VYLRLWAAAIDAHRLTVLNSGRAIGPGWSAEDLERLEAAFHRLGETFEAMRGMGRLDETQDTPREEIERLRDDLRLIADVYCNNIGGPTY